MVRTNLASPFCKKEKCAHKNPIVVWHVGMHVFALAWHQFIQLVLSKSAAEKTTKHTRKQKKNYRRDHIFMEKEQRLVFLQRRQQHF